MKRTLAIALIAAGTLVGCHHEESTTPASTTQAVSAPSVPPASTATAPTATVPAEAATSMASNTPPPTDSANGPMSGMTMPLETANPNLNPAIAAVASGSANLAATILDPKTIANPTARQAYEMAKEVPERLAKMYCYCHCHEHMGHVSLLTCYQGHHAEECETCQQEAVQAWRDAKDGLPVSVSQRAADFAYNNGAPPPSLP